MAKEMTASQMGKKGGVARWEGVSAQDRTEYGRTIANIRWGGKKRSARRAAQKGKDKD